jgi:MFS family permease
MPAFPSTRLAMRCAMLEAAVVGGMFACTDLWLVPLLKLGLGAHDTAIGLLSVVPMLALMVLGVWARPLIVALGGNQRTIILTCLVQVGCLLALSLPLHLSDRPWSVPLATGLVMALGVVGGLGGPAWVAWMGGVVPMPVRGRYTALRNRIFNATRLGFVGLMALVMWQLPANAGPWGLQAVLLVAAASRCGSGWLQWRAGTPPQRQPRPQGNDRSSLLAAQQGFLDFALHLNRSSLGRWTLVWASLMAGMMVAGPFFAPYMLAPVAEGGLGLTAFWYSFLMVVNPVVKLLTYPAAGWLIETRGSAAVLRAGVALCLFIPVGWMATSNFWLLVACEVLSGVAWALMECSVGVLLFSCHPDQLARARLIGYHQTVFAVFTCAGSALGTFLVALDSLPALWGSRYHTIFFISMVLRLPAVVLATMLLPALRRADLPDRHLWRLVPGSGLTQTIGRGLMGVFRRPEGE